MSQHNVPWGGGLLCEGILSKLFELIYDLLFRKTLFSTRFVVIKELLSIPSMISPGSNLLSGSDSTALVLSLFGGTSCLI
jgi:hypothetical protein